MTLRIGWFSTGAGSDSQRQRLLRAAVSEMRGGRLDAEIAFVFCNRERGENEGTDSYLDLVESLGLPLIAFSSRDFRRARGGALSKPGEPLAPWRKEYDHAVANLVEPRPFDVGVLAGYMLIFTGEMCNRYPLLNLHPAEPGGPAGTWQEVIKNLIAQRATRSGVMVHLSTEELDAGPVVSYCLFPLRGEDIDGLWEAHDERGERSTAEESELFREIRRRGAVREGPLVLATLHALAQGRIRIENDDVLGERGPVVGGLDLTHEVDEAVLRVPTQRT
jgi:folate-dependent phosphoribosylglycinamide formyltransferase PurN